MRRSSWYALLLVALVGLGIAGLLGLTLVSYVGWLGIMFVGLFITMTGTRAELDADAPAMSVYLMRRQYEQVFEGTAEDRLAKFAARIERNRWLYIVRTIGIATTFLGLSMFIRHRL